MPKSQSKASQKTSRQHRAPKRGLGWRRWLWRLCWYGGLFTGLAIAGYLVYLDRTVSATFEGRRWSVPAQVYALPVELHAGATLDAAALRAELRRLGYRVDANLTLPGTYKQQADSLLIHLRAFHFLEGWRNAQKITVEFERGRIARVSENQRDIPLIQLDPPNIGSFFPSHGEDRIILTPAQVPPLLAAGLKAVEDRNFDTHVGFSVRGILRALVVNLKAGRRAQGGSTLTQQLVKSYFLDNRRTVERKLQEVAMAVILEARFSKEDLLTAYTNEIFLGQSGHRAIHGFGLGAQYYFNKPLAELKPAEIATLLAIIRGPSFYNPFRHPQRTLERRDRILGILHQDGLLDAAELAASRRAPLGVTAEAGSGGAYYPAFMDRVRAELRTQYDTQALNSAGLRIFTSLRPATQELAQRSVTATLAQIEREREMTTGSLQAAALIADTQTGEIYALIGGRQGRVDGFNRAINAERPVGSLIKPLVYLRALETGRHLADLIEDRPITITAAGTSDWQPKNFDGRSRGEIPLIRGLAESLNLATVNLGMQLGLEPIQRRFAELSGHPARNRYPSFLLGAEPLSPLEVLEFYGNFASGGFHTPPKAVIAVLDESGHPLTHHPFVVEQSIAPTAAAAINRALEIAMANGTGKNSPFARRGVAGKTGTSNDNRDSWFVGFDNRLLSVVWVGRDDNAVTGLTGSSGALRAWNAIAQQTGIDPLVHAPGEHLIEIEFSSGRRAHAGCADVVRVSVPDPASVPVKPGCGLQESLGARMRRWFSD